MKAYQRGKSKETQNTAKRDWKISHVSPREWLAYSSRAVSVRLIVSVNKSANES